MQLRRSVLFPVIAVTAVLLLVIVYLLDAGRSSGSAAVGHARPCVYTSDSISRLATFSQTVGQPITCAVVYNSSATTWAQLASPWFLTGNNQDLRWDKWAAADPSHTLVIAESLVPANPQADWRAQGAAGAYDATFAAFGKQLVSMGLGASIIRLAPEGNGDWFVDNAGNGLADYRNWATYWARVAGILHHTAGAHFQLDWNITAGQRPIPLPSWYPGDKAVDIIGVDQHDIAVTKVGTAQPQRWQFQLTQADGLDSVLGFAKAHDKPISVPEWGVSGADELGAGDDPYYVTQMAEIFATERVAYQAYWDKSGTADELAKNPKSLAVYRQLITPNR
jgi:hypothetical protein